MKFVLDIYNELELKEFLLSQDGINDVNIYNNKFVTELVIDYDKDVTPFIIYKYIKLFDGNDISSLLSFDKNVDYDTCILKYNVKDMCCENCYKVLIEELFLDDKVKSVKSNFGFNNVHNIEFVIEYNKDYDERELIKFIKKNI